MSDPTPAEKQKAELRAFIDRLRPMAESAERFAIAPGTSFGDARYFARIAYQVRALIVAIG